MTKAGKANAPAPVRVVVNGRFLDRPTTGVERFAREIVRDIAIMIVQRDPVVAGLTFEIARPQSDHPRFLTDLPEHRIGRFRGQLWEQVDLPRHARGAILLNLCGLAPLVHPASITCVHDAHPWLIPDNFSWKFRRWYGIMIPRVIARSRKWTTVSQYSADKLVELGIACRRPDRITYNAADSLGEVAGGGDAPLPPAVAAVISGSPYVLCLGSRSKNKNVDLVVRMADQLAASGIRTVVAGGSANRVFGGDDQDAPDNVVMLGRVSDAALIELYRHACAFLFPSLFEGFGIPAIEAMGLGCPVVASNSSAMPEVLGDAAVLLDPYREGPWIDAVRRIAVDDRYNNELIEKGYRQAEKYRWRHSSLKFIELIKQIAE